MGKTSVENEWEESPQSLNLTRIAGASLQAISRWGEIKKTDKGGASQTYLWQLHSPPRTRSKPGMKAAAHSTCM